MREWMWSILDVKSPEMQDGTWNYWTIYYYEFGDFSFPKTSWFNLELYEDYF